MNHLNQIFSIGKISRQYQHLPMTILPSKQGLDQSDRTQITHVFDGL
ncbi:hypothetical protein H6F32_01725 [Anabaena sp. FACHB-1237]|nr:hypothetical protein [Anabaena sp. FACHB-1237]MBD2136330.1 hypothetical protein [Anabaena sp. FACHB-1237]